MNSTETDCRRRPTAAGTSAWDGCRDTKRGFLHSALHQLYKHCFL